MFDENYYADLALEERAEKKQINERRNEIMKMRAGQRKQEAYRQLFPKLPVDNMVY